jgi:hypothetical protein
MYLQGVVIASILALSGPVLSKVKEIGSVRVVTGQDLPVQYIEVRGYTCSAQWNLTRRFFSVTGRS